MENNTLPWRMKGQQEAAEYQISKLPEKLFINPETTFLDPAMGGGQYLAAVVKRCEKYHKRDQILPRIYGVESGIPFVIHAKRYYNLRGANFFTKSEDLPLMNFDQIVGNPPYQRSWDVRNVSTPLWHEFIYEGMALLKEGGTLSFVVPSSWLTRRNNKAWRTIKENDLVFLDPDVKWAFPDVGGVSAGFCVIQLVKRPYSGLTLLPDGSTLDIVNDQFPTNNKLLNGENLSFIRANISKVLQLEFKTGEHRLSINGPNWSKKKTETHQYETYYSGRVDRRSIWCDKEVGNYGEWKLVVPNSGRVLENREITTKGVGRQAEYVLGTKKELERLSCLLESEDSMRMTELMAEGGYRFPLKWIVND